MIVYVLIWIFFISIWSALFLEDLEQIQDKMDKKTEEDNKTEKVIQKLQVFTEQKDMEDKRYGFLSQIGIGIKWVLISIGAAIILTVSIEVIKILK